MDAAKDHWNRLRGQDPSSHSISCGGGLFLRPSVTALQFSSPMFKPKRIYEDPRPSDGYRILVDRVWPRGISKEKGSFDLWLRDVAPSDELRRWFAHDPRKWVAFQEKYRQELKGKKDLLEQIRQLEKKHGTLTLLYAAKDAEHCNAAALKQFLRGRR